MFGYDLLGWGIWNVDVHSNHDTQGRESIGVMRDRWMTTRSEPEG